MLGNILSSSRSMLSLQETLDLANSYLETASKAKNLKIALVLCDDAEASLSQMKKAVKKALAPETLADQTLRDKIATVYFEHGKVLEQLGQPDKAQASYSKAQKWGHPVIAAQSNSLSAYAVLSPAALTNRFHIAARTRETLHAPALPSAVNPSSSISADIPSTLAEPAQNVALSPLILESIEEKNDLINELFIETLKTFQSLDLSSVWPSAFLVYAHDNPHYGMADAGTAKFLIDHLVKLGVNLYSDQRPKGLQAPTALSTRVEAARVDDILTSQLCLLPTAIGGIQPVDKVIVCGSQVLGHYLQWGEAGKHYQAYYKDLKKAYGLAQQSPTHAEAEIRKVVNTYSQQADFHHVLTEMAFLKIRTDYLDQHGIIPISLCANGYELCVQDIVEATTVRIEDMPRFASQQASGQAVYQQQGRHLVFFKLLERLLAQNGAEALLRTFWTAYSDLIQRLNSEASVPKAAEYVRVWGQISQNVQATLKTLQAQVDEHQLREALTRYASLDRLAIQRLSGPPLSMKDCYINLAIVEHEKVRKEEKQPKEGEEEELQEEEAAQNRFHRPPSFEAIDSNQQKLVPLEKLFDPRELSDGKTVTPQRILIRGRAGVGKTTLSKKIVYEYTQKAQWRDRFDWLLWVPLRMLKGKSNCDLVTLFHETYFQSSPNGQALAKALEIQINGPAKDKTLFVLDGWDEVAQEWGEHEPMSEFLKQLLNQPAVLITSRPYVELKQAQAMDLELETVGFSPKNVEAYLDNLAIMPILQAQEMKRFIQSAPFIQGLVNVPIQLDALCYSWDEIKRLQQEMSGAMNVTALYQAIMNKLWRKDMLRLGKREGGELLTAEAIYALRSPLRIERWVKAEQNFLSALAFKGLQENRIEFNTRYLDNLIEQLEAEGLDLPIMLEANLKKLSFLHTDGTVDGKSNYHFMHLTFQEFFAAKHFVQCWETGQEIALLLTDTKRWTKAQPEVFVRQHKYNPRYEIFWWFVSGLLRKETLNRFFDVLEAEPRDLFGASHQRLMMNCLHEAPRSPDVGLSSDNRNKLKQHLAQWLQFEIGRTGEGMLAYQPTFPEHLLLDCLKETVSVRTKSAVANTLGRRSVLLNAATQALIELTKDQEDGVRRSAVEALGKQPSLSESAMTALIELTKDQEDGMRCSAAEALGKQPSLPESAMTVLIALMKDRNDGVRRSAVEALGKQSSLPESALIALIELTKDYDNKVRRRAADLLGKQLSLSDSALMALITLMKFWDDEVKSHAADLLGQQPSLPESALIALIVLMKDGDGEMGRRAVDLLGKQPSLPDSALIALIELMKDQNDEVMNRATDVLGQQPSLPDSALMALIALMKDQSDEVMNRAASALGQQPSLPDLALSALIELTKDQDDEVRSHAIEVLAQQPLLPDSVLMALIELMKNQDYEVMSRAAEALGQQPWLPDSALTAMIELMKDEDEWVRRCAAEALGQQFSLPDSTLNALIELTKGQERGIRYSVAGALSKQFSLPDSALNALIELTKDQGDEVRRRAAFALGQQFSLPDSALNALIELTKDKSDDVRRGAAGALSKQSSLSNSALNALIELTKDKNDEVRRRAASALGQQLSLPDSALNALIELTKDKSDEMRCSAAGALSQQSSLSDSALHALIELTKDKNDEVRRRAASALGQQLSLPDSALNALIELTQDENDEVRSHATRALSQQCSLPGLVLNILDQDYYVKRIVIDALGQQSSLPESALTTLIELTKDQNSDVRSRVIDALGKQSSLSESALSALIELTKDQNSDVRSRAADALDKQSSLPDWALLALVKLMKDENYRVRSSAANALGKQLSLSKGALTALTKPAKDKHSDVRSRADDVLGTLSLLPDWALLALVKLMGDEDYRGMSRTDSALGKQPALPDEVLRALIKLILSQDGEVRKRASYVLGKQPSLPDWVLLALVNLIQDQNDEVRDSAASALGKQSSLPDWALLALVKLMKDENYRVRSSADSVLGKQSSLSESALTALIELTDDQDYDVRKRAAEALGKQSSLPDSALLALIKLTKDWGKYVKSSAAEALGKQSSLPDSALIALIELMKDQYGEVRRSAADALGRCHGTLYRLLPTFNKKQIALIYTEYLLKQRFDQSLPLYIQEGSLYFYTAQGPQSVPFSDVKQEITFQQAVQQAKKAAGLPLISKD